MSDQPAAAGTTGLPRGVVVLLGLASAIVILGGMRFASGLVAPIVLALVLTIAVAPLSHWARRKGVPAWATVILSLIAVYAVVLVLVGGIALSTVKLATILPQYADKAQEQIHELSKRLADAGFDKAPTQEALSHLDVGRLLDLVQNLLASFLGTLGDLFFLVTLLFFLAADVTGAGARAAKLAETRPHLADALAKYVKATQSYLIVTTVFGAIVAVLDTIALYLLNVPLPLTWGLLSFLTNFIPNIGFVIGVIPPALLALLDGGVGHMVVVIVVYSAINVVLQTFIQPRVVGDAVGLSTTMTFLSLALWTFVLGPLGALLAVPMSLLVRALLVDADPGAEVDRGVLRADPQTALGRSDAS